MISALSPLVSWLVFIGAAIACYGGAYLWLLHLAHRELRMTREWREDRQRKENR